jgi:hypothetical protein
MGLWDQARRCWMHRPGAFGREVLGSVKVRESTHRYGTHGIRPDLGRLPRAPR